MRTVIIVALLVLSSLATGASTANATVHELVGSFCAKVAFTNQNVLDPPGQTPSGPPATWDRSDLRALQATGILTLVRDANGNVIDFVLDMTVPAAKDVNFAAFSRCRALNP